MRVPRMPLAVQPWSVIGLLALTTFVAARLPAIVVETREHLLHAAREVGGPENGALGRFRGRAYVEAIGRIRARIPEDGEYVILAVPLGLDVLVRFDLAPRRAVFGGHVADVARNITAESANSLPRWTVVPTDPPFLVDTRVLAATGRLP